MIEYAQGTISGKRSTIDDIFNKVVESSFQGTLGNDLFWQYSQPFKSSNIIGRALLGVDATKPQEMINIALRILLNIQTTVDAFKDSRTFPDYIPQVRTFAPEDGSILIEWNFDNFRIGFNIEEDISENSWYLISNNLGKVSASGYIIDSNIESIVSWVLAFIFLSNQT